MKLHCPHVKTWGVLTVLGASLIHLSFGYMNAVGNLDPYLDAYMGITKDESMFFKSTMSAGQAISMPLGALLSTKIDFRIVTAISIFLTSAGLFLSRLTLDHGIGAFISTYSLIFGIGIGLPHSVLYSVASNWFPNNRGIIYGIIGAGFALGAVVFIPIQDALVNPNYLEDLTDPAIKSKLPNAFLVLGGIVLAIQLVGIGLIRDRNAEDDEDDESESNDSESSRAILIENYTTREAAKTIDFYLLIFLTLMNIIVVGLISSTYKIYGKERGFDARFLLIVRTISSVVNCVSRIIWGIVVDKFSFKCPLGWLQIMWGLLLVTFPFITIGEGTSAKVLFGFWVCLLFSCNAGHFVLLPAAATRIFGPKHMATTFAVIFLIAAPGTLGLSAFLSQFHFEGQFIPVYTNGSLLCFFGFILSTYLMDINGTCIGKTDVCVRLCDRCRTEPEEESEMMVLSKASPPSSESESDSESESESSNSKRRSSIQAHPESGWNKEAGVSFPDFGDFKPSWT